MKKSILATTAFLMMASTVTVISCNKDNEPMQKISITSVAMKGVAEFDQLSKSFRDFFTACDNAYHNDKDAFLAACEANDEAAFLEMTGLKPEFFSFFNENAMQQLNKFTEENPGYEIKENVCEPCLNNPLAVIGALASTSSGKMEELIPATLKDYDYYNIFDAISWYKEMPEFNMTTSIIAHVGEYFKKIQSEYFNTELVLAKFDGCEIHEGDEFPMAFDEKVFKEKYELILKEETGYNWVAEEVKIDIHDFNGELTPVLKVAAYNTDQEKGTTLFVYSKAVNAADGLFKLAGRTGDSFSCVATGGCAGIGGGCDITVDILGRPECTPCTAATGECTPSTNTSSNLISAFNVMFSILK